MNKTSFSGIILGLLISGSTAFAEVTKNAAQGTSVEDIPLDNVLSQGTIYQGGMLRAVISLFIVIGLIYLTAWAYKRLNIFNADNLAKPGKKVNANKFNLISTQALGANKNLHVVEINGKYLVIGSTQNNISLIKEFDKNLVENLSDISLVTDNKKPSAPVEENPAEKLSQETKNLIEDPQLDELLQKYKEL